MDFVLRLMRLLQLQRRHGLGRDSRHTDAIEELKNAFEIAERASPGITNRYRTTSSFRL